MKASLVWPAFEDFSGLDVTWLPHGVTQMATEANLKGHEVEVLDGRIYNLETMKDIIKNTASEIIGISILSAYVGYAKELMAFIRNERPDLKIAIGGIHPTVCPEDFDVKEFDWLVKGEGEITFEEILSGKHEKGYIRGKTPDLDKLAPIDRNLVKVDEEPFHGDKPFATVIIGRGCPFSCTFCQPAERDLFGKKLRMRPVENVVNELVSLGVRNFMIHDDCFISSPRYVNEFCDALPDGMMWWCQGRADLVCNHIDLIKKMRDKGLAGMILGHESGDDRVLKSLNKGATVQQNIESARILHALGVMVWSNIMLGTPGEPPSAVINTLRMLGQISPETISLTVFTPHPGSYLYETCKKNNLIIQHEENWTYYNRGRFEPKIIGPDYAFLAWAASQVFPPKEQE